MLSTLYLFVAAMAWVPLSIHANDTNHWKLFPLELKNIKDNTFPVVKTINGSSDMILVKCPRIGHKHFKKDDSFETDESIDKSTLYIPNNQIPLSWIPLMKGSSGSASILCGIINLQQNENTRKNYKWSYNVKWGNALNTEKIIIKEKIVNTVEGDHEKCTANGGNTLIFIKKKEGGIINVKPYPKQLENPYAYQMFYYFKIPSESNSHIIEEPCGIYKSYTDSPQIIIPSHEIFSETEGSEKIVTINTEGAQGKEKNFTVQLQLKDNPNFYRGEKISLTKMRYLEGGLNLINNSKSIITL